MADRKSIDQEFVDSYNKRGIQPSTGSVRNVKTEKQIDPTERRGGVSAYAASTLGESMQSGGQKMQQADPNSQIEGVRSVVAEQYQNADQRISRTGKSLILASKRVRGREKITAAGVASRTLHRSVTLGIWSWGFFVWFWFQLPFTIISIVFMALTEALYQFSLTLQFNDSLGGYLVSAVDTLFDTLFDVLNYFTKLAGLDLSILNPANLFLTAHVLVVLVGWGMLLAIGIIYTVTGQKAFSGRGAGAKNTMFLLVFIGYTIPIINLLPLFFFWTLLVFKNPR